MGRITIQDISRLAGTSPSTVSRVLTGSAVVSPEKRDAVERAIRHLNYRPSHIARSLKTRVTLSVGLLLNDITNPFYSAIARGVEDEAHRHGYSLILCNTSEDPQRERLYLEVLQDKHIDGIILGTTGSNDDYLIDLARRVPVIQVDRAVPHAAVGAVMVDNFHGTYTATRKLIERGYRRIGVIKWSRSLSTLLEREAGYRHALTEAGLPYSEGWTAVADGLSSHDSMEVTQSLLSGPDRPEAIIALNNQLGLGVLAASRQLGLRIPADLALIVFDDLELFSFFQPPITAIEQPAYEMGERAMQMLLARLEMGESAPLEQVVLPTRYIERESL